jgi:two-component system, NtrC family, response regulator AtoC
MSLPHEVPEKLMPDEARPQSQPAEAQHSAAANTSDEPIPSLRSVRVRVEIEAIRTALRRTGWNRKQAARLLNISYRGLLYKIRQYDITAA